MGRRPQSSAENWPAAPILWQQGVKKDRQECPPAAATGLQGAISPLATKNNWGGCWACLGNGYNNLSGSTFDGTQFSGGRSTGACFINCTNQSFMGLYSFPPGSCGLAFCDGSAHMVSENLSVVVFCRLDQLPRAQAGHGQSQF